MNNKSLTKCLFKLFALCVMFGGLITILPENKVKADSDCFQQYSDCGVICDDPMQTPPSQRDQCLHTCFYGYGTCRNDEFLNQEGEVIGELEENQQIPDFSAYRRCMSSCHHCPLIPVSEPVTEEDVQCVDNFVGCKISCLSML